MLLLKVVALGIGANTAIFSLVDQIVPLGNRHREQTLARMPGLLPGPHAAGNYRHLMSICGRRQSGQAWAWLTGRGSVLPRRFK